MSRSVRKKIFGGECIFIILLSIILSICGLPEFGTLLCLLAMSVNWIRAIFNDQEKRNLKRHCSSEPRNFFLRMTISEGKGNLSVVTGEEAEREIEKFTQEQILILDEYLARIKRCIAAYAIVSAIEFAIFLV